MTYATMALFNMEDRMEIPALPGMPAAVTALEQRFREIRADRLRLENELKSLETNLARIAIGSDDAALIDAIVAGKPIDRANLPADAAELRARLALVIKADQKLAGQLAEARAKHRRDLARALKPMHRRAIRRIWIALQELERANAEEQAVREIVPGLYVELRPADFPNVGTLRSTDAPIRRWQRFIENMYPGFADDDEPEPTPPPKARRSLFGGRANGAGEPTPLAAKGGD